MLIKCYSDTAGESYAKANGFRYEVLDAPDDPPDDPVAPPHTHVYSSEILRKPTCTEVGIKLLTCSCGDNRVETIPAISHNYGLWSITKYPTCHEYGEVTRKCLNCATVDVQKVDKTNHEYKDSVTKATLTKNGLIVNKCSICGDVKSNRVIYYPKTITLSKTSYIYTGKVQRPTVTVKDANGKAIPASNYTVTYSSGCKDVGRYAVKVTFKGYYGGAKTLTYTIIPKGTVISRQTAAKKGFTVAWAISATQTTAYQIQYTTDANFKSGVKTVTINKNTVVSKAITNLLAGRKYYVRVRTYRTVNKVNYFSVWSGAKAVVTKK